MTTLRDGRVLRLGAGRMGMRVDCRRFQSSHSSEAVPSVSGEFDEPGKICPRARAVERVVSQQTRRKVEVQKKHFGGLMQFVWTGPGTITCYDTQVTGHWFEVPV